MKKHYVNYEYLRAIACIAVVVTHVAGLYVEVYGYRSGDFETFVISDIWRVSATFSIPIFVMISGAFNLAYAEKIDYLSFYKKQLLKLALPTFLMVLLSVIYKLAVQHLGFDAILLDILRGEPFDHLWYMYMLVGLYFVTPLLRHLANDLTDTQYGIAALILCVVGAVVRYTCSVSWPIRFMQFLGYYLLGYYLKRVLLDQEKGNKRWSRVFLFGTIIFMLASLVIDIFMYLSGAFDMYFLGSHFITTFMMSVSIFCFFTVAAMRKVPLMSAISKHSFLIYLFHPIFLKVIRPIALRFSGIIVIIMIPLITIITVCLCMVCAVAYNWVINGLRKKFLRE